MVWGGISLEGSTDSFDNGTLTNITVGIGMKCLEPLSEPTLMQQNLGSSWSMTMSDNDRSRQFLEDEGSDTTDCSQTQ